MENKIKIGEVPVFYYRDDKSSNWSEATWPIYATKIGNLVFYSLGEFALQRGNYTFKIGNRDWTFNARYHGRDRKYYCYIPEPQIIDCSNK